MFSRYLHDSSLKSLCSEEYLLRKMLDFEVALAQAQASLGIIPDEVAHIISDILPNLSINPAELAEGMLQNGIPTITLLAIVKKQLPDVAKDYLHWGATSQDVMDTAQVLVLKEIIAQLESRIQQLLEQFAILIENQGDIPMIGRTRTQQAVPILFGQKIATWVNPLIRHLERLSELKIRLLVVQLGGAAGNLSAMNNQGMAVSVALADKLGLSNAMPWHTQRDNFAEFTNWLALFSGSLGKMGQDILVMSQTEINEAIENSTGGGKSSTMPHKNNPVLSEALVMIARKNALLASVQLQSLVHANERDATAWALEWENVGQMMHYTGAALNHSFTIAKHLKINEKSTQRNLDLLNGLIYSEAASFILAKKIGRDKAKEIVNEACKKVVNEGKNLTEMLSELTPDLTIDWVSELSIEKHLGTSKEQSNQAIKLIRNQ